MEPTLPNRPTATATTRLYPLESRACRIALHRASAALYCGLCVSRWVPERLKLAPCGSGKPATPLLRMQAVNFARIAVMVAGTFTEGIGAPGEAPAEEPPPADPAPDPLADPAADDGVDPGRAFVAAFRAALTTGMHAASARR